MIHESQLRHQGALLPLGTSPKPSAELSGSALARRSRCQPELPSKTMPNSEEQMGKIMGSRWENHGTSWGNHEILGRIMGKYEKPLMDLFGKFMGKSPN